MKKFIISTIITLAIAGCASSSSKDQVAGVEPENKKSSIGYECEKIYPLGSSIPKKICSTAAQRKEIDKATKEAVRTVRVPVDTCRVVGGASGC